MNARSNRWWTLVFLLGCFLFVGSTLTGCKEEGPAEEAGEKLDDAAEDAEDAIDDATGGGG